MSGREVQTRRGIPLTVLLVILTVAELGVVLFGIVSWRSIADHGQDHPEVPLLGALLGIIGLGALAGMWLWKRRAVYLFAAVAAIGLVSDAILGLPSIALLLRLALLAALGWSIRQKWNAFH